MRHNSTLLVLLALLVGCADPNPEPLDLKPLIAHAESTYSDTALTYLRAVFDTLETHHVYGETYDWEELWLATLEVSEGATTTAQTHDAIRFAVADLNDPHAGFGIDPDSVSSVHADSSAAGGVVELLPMTSRMIAEEIAYVDVPRIGWPVGAIAHAYAQNLQDVIGRLSEQQPCGWIVDVRRNTGGNMWPMIAGAGPLLGEGEVGYFVDRYGDRLPWTYRDGTASVDTISTRAGSEPVRIANTPPVAVLTSSRTASAAEALVVAFRGRPDTRAFGRPTAGAATSPEYFEFGGGAWLSLSTHYFADRTGTVYRSAIEPDVYVEADMWDDHAAAESTAAGWLLETGPCR